MLPDFCIQSGFDLVYIGFDKTKFKSFTCYHNLQKQPVAFIIRRNDSTAVYYAGLAKYKHVFANTKFSEYPEDFHVHVFEDKSLGIVGLSEGEYHVYCFSADTLDWMFQQYVFNSTKEFISGKPDVKVPGKPEYYITGNDLVWTKQSPTVDTSKFFDTVTYSGNGTNTNTNKSIDTSITTAYLTGVEEGCTKQKLRVFSKDSKIQSYYFKGYTKGFGLAK